MAPDERDRLLEVRRILADPPIGPAQVLAPRGAEHGRAASASASRSSTVPLLPISPAVRSHRPTRMPSAAVARDGAAEADLDVVGMRTEDEQIDRHALRNLFRVGFGVDGSALHAKSRADRLGMAAGVIG